MSRSLRSYLAAFRLDIIRSLCARMFHMRTGTMTRDQILDSLNQHQALRLATALDI